MINILAHFPKNAEPRQEQIKILNSVQKAIEDKKKFIIIQAPTGAGKSYISATLSNSSRFPDASIVDLIDSYNIFQQNYGGLTSGSAPKYQHEEMFNSLPSYGAAVLTVSKSLQEQYKDLFDTARILKGKQNYVCSVDNDFDCDIAPCYLKHDLIVTCKAEHSCPALNAMRDSLKSRFAVYNYSSFLTLPNFVKRRQYLICDEASELEDELVKYYSCSAEYSKIDLSSLHMSKLLKTDTNNAFQWLNELSSAIKEKCNEYEENIQKNKNRKHILMGQLGFYRYYKNLYDKISSVLRNWYKTEYIVEITKDNATFTPLNVNVLAQEFFNYSDTIILMSATLIDHEMYAKTLGIEKKDYVYIEAESTFDPEKSPIYIDTKVKLNYKNIEQCLPGMLEKMLIICDHHKNDKGIIHTHTFKITDYIINHIKNNKRFLAREEGITNENILNEHYMREDGTVLISPSLGFGTDLADDFGRFSIIMKTPYLPLGSERIKRLAQRSQQWYEMKALVSLVQMCGRTTRNKDDYSETYILDGAVLDLIKRNRNKIPHWFLKRVH